MVMALAACAATARVYDFGAQYLGTPYVADPLGEGAGYDDDPLIRTDAFDCQTFVETVISCGKVSRLNRIRYADGDVKFEKRNHFFSADWIPNNSDIVQNISAEFGPTKTRSGVIDKQSWFKKVHNIDIDIAPLNAEIEYVPYSDIRDINVAVPVLVAFVVDNPQTAKSIGSDILVSHVGFLMPGGVLRHASSSMGAVVDVDFQEYIAASAGIKTRLGVAFFKIKETCK